MAEDKPKAEKKDRPAKILGGKKSKKKSSSKVKSIHVHKATGGGFIMHHDMESDPGNPVGSPSEEHIAPDLAALKAHMDQHFAGHPSMGEGPEEPPEPQGAPAPGM